MKLKKLMFSTLAAILSTGLLFGCGTTGDQPEPDPSEEPAEQQQDHNNNGSDINEDPTINENIHNDQDQNGQDKNDQDNKVKDLDDILQPGHQ